MLFHSTHQAPNMPRYIPNKPAKHIPRPEIITKTPSFPAHAQNMAHMPASLTFFSFHAHALTPPLHVTLCQDTLPFPSPGVILLHPQGYSFCLQGLPAHANMPCPHNTPQYFLHMQTPNPRHSCQTHILAPDARYTCHAYMAYTASSSLHADAFPFPAHTCHQTYTHAMPK